MAINIDGREVCDVEVLCRRCKKVIIFRGESPVGIYKREPEESRHAV